MERKEVKGNWKGNQDAEKVDNGENIQVNETRLNYCKVSKQREKKTGREKKGRKRENNEKKLRKKGENGKGNQEGRWVEDGKK